MASSKSFISLPSTPKLGASSSPLAGGGSRLSSAPKLTKSTFNFRPIGKSSLVDTISAAPPGQANMEAMAESLTETNRILVEIQNQLAMDFAYRIAKEKGELQQQRKEESRRKFSAREKGLEGFKGIFKAVSSVGKAIAAPFTGIFDKIQAVLGILAMGVANNAIFEWLKDENNQKKLKKFFNILTTNWKLIAKVFATIIAAGLAIKVMGAISTIAAVIGILASPVMLKLLAVAGTAAGITWLADKIKTWTAGGKEYRILYEKNNEKLNEFGVGQPSSSLSKAAPLLRPNPEGGYFGMIMKGMDQNTGQFGDLNTASVNPETGKLYATKTQLDALDNWKTEKLRIDGLKEKPDGERKLGGPGYKGKTYRVGEAGPELVTFPENGIVFNHTDTNKIVQQIANHNGKRSVRIYDLRTTTPKKSSNQPKLKTPATTVPELSAVDNNSERMKYMSAYGLA